MTTVTLDTLLETFSGSDAPIEERIAEFVDSVVSQASWTYGELARGKTDKRNIKYEELDAAGKAALSESRYEEAVALFSAGAGINTNSADAYHNLGVAWLKVAEDKLFEEKLLEQHALSAPGPGSKTFLNFARDALVIAYNRSKTVPISDGDRQKYLGSLFEAYNLLGDYDSILLEAVRLKAEEIDAPETLHLIGLAYGYAREDWKNAEKYFILAKNRSAAENDGKPDPVYLLRLVEAYAESGQNANASLQLQILNAELDRLQYDSTEMKLLSYSVALSVIQSALEEGMAHGSYTSLQENTEFNALKRRIDKELEKDSRKPA